MCSDGELFRNLGQTGLLYEVIVNEIEQLVVSGQLKAGDPLPPERELGLRFGVSRTAVREAIKVLSQKQLVTVRRGRGAIVAHPSPQTVSASLGLLLKVRRASPAQLTEVRRSIEPEMAALAAEKATPEQIRELEALAIAYRDSVGNPSKAVPLDLAFHKCVSESAHNEVASAIIDSVEQLFLQSMIHHSRVEGAMEKSALSHHQVYSAISERDPEAARHYMRRHLDNVWRYQQSLLDDPAQPILI